MNQLKKRLAAPKSFGIGARMSGASLIGISTCNSICVF
jgi:hypothetical protein